MAAVRSSRGPRVSRLAFCGVVVLLVAQLVLTSCSLSSPAPASPTPGVLPTVAVAATTGAPATATLANATPTSLAPPATITPTTRPTATPAAVALCAFTPPFAPAAGTPGARGPAMPTRAASTATIGFDGVPGAGAPAQTPPSIPLPKLAARYKLAIDEVRFNRGHLRTKETVQVTNQENCALDRLFFSVTVARWGWFTLDGVQVDGQPANATLDRTVLTVPLGRPLTPGATATVTFDFRLDVGVASDPYTPSGFPGTTQADDILRLAYWFPVLSDDHQYPPFLDPPYTATADYEVTLTAPADLVIAHTGVQTREQTNADGTVTRAIDAPNVRDFALSMSPNFQVARRTTANGVEVQVYYSPQSFGANTTATAMQARIDQTLDAGVLAIEQLSASIGPYPYPVFRIVDGGPRLGGGIEFPMLVSVNLVTPGIVRLVYHEAAHQWLYGILGTRTQQDPWIDEGGASFLEAYLSGRLSPTPPPRRRYAYKLNDPVWAVPPGNGQATAYPAFYDQGEEFYDRVRRAMGDEAFWGALQQLYRDHRFGIVTPRDLLAAWQQAAPVDLRPLFREYLEYDWIDQLSRS